MHDGPVPGMTCPDIPFASVHCAAWDQRREDKLPGTGCGWQLFNKFESTCLWDDEGKKAVAGKANGRGKA